MVQEHVYPPSNSGNTMILVGEGFSAAGAWSVTVVDLAVSGKKYASCQADSLNLYNLDHTLWKTMTIPNNGATTRFVSCISENLFKLDSKVEYAIAMQYASGSWLMEIRDEDGNVLNSINDASQIGLFKTAPDTTKAIVCAGWPDVSGVVFSLPGNLPCEQCVNNNNLSVNSTGPVAMPVLSDPVPNPAAGAATVHYRLPAGQAEAVVVLYNVQGLKVRTYKVVQGGQSFSIETATLPQGTYYYSLSTSTGSATARKMLVVK